MPEMGGVAEGDAIQEADPSISIIYSTGYDKDHAFIDSAAKGAHEIMRKPPPPVAELSRTIRKARPATPPPDSQSC